MIAESGGEVVVYRRPDGGGAVVQLRARGGTVRLSQAAVADLYATSVSNVSHIVRRVLTDG
ncbi:MAG: hypothetical protein LBJ44_11825 [Propionibacteriaceae bacterium]|nr:hypothetical protein [Propionibacteriaceae bacterium]